MVKAVRVHSVGGTHSVQYEDIQISALPEGQVEIRHTAVVATSDDVPSRHHHRSDSRTDMKYPYTPGTCGIGIITEVGSGVLDHQIGQRVGYVTVPELGSFCELRFIPEKYLISLPDSLNDEEAASILYEGLMAWMLVRRVFPVRRGDAVLIHGISSGIGSLLGQWTKHLGAVVLGTVSFDDEVQSAEKMGADHTLLYSSFEEKVMEVTDGVGVSAVYDAGDEDSAAGSLACLALKGILVLVGKSPSLGISEIAEKGKSLAVAVPVLQDYVASRQDLLEASSELFSLLKSKVLTINLKRKCPLQKAAEALEEMATSARFQSLILLPPVTEPKDVPHGS